MTYVGEIVERAMRETGLLGDIQYPSPSQNKRAVEALKSLVVSAVGTDAGEGFTQWPLGNFGRTTQSRENISTQRLSYPPINHRLVATNEAALVVNLPTNPSPGARFAIADPFSRLAAFPVTLNGNGYAIEGAATLVLNENAMSRQWFFREDLGGWVRITPIDLSALFPFPEEYDDYFVTKLSMRISPRYGRSTPPETLARYKEQQRDFQNRYLQSSPLQINTEASHNSRQSFENWAETWAGGSTQAWNTGGWW